MRLRHGLRGPLLHRLGQERWRRRWRTGPHSHAASGHLWALWGHTRWLCCGLVPVKRESSLPHGLSSYQVYVPTFHLLRETLEREQQKFERFFLVLLLCEDGQLLLPALLGCIGNEALDLDQCCIERGW